MRAKDLLLSLGSFESGVLAVAGERKQIDIVRALEGVGTRNRGLSHFSIRINDQWRVCFEWPKDAPGPSNVEIVDYH